MKKFSFGLFVLLGLALLQPAAYSSSNSNEKVTICHREGNGGSHAITVSVNAVPAHLAHGDKLGNCSVTPE